MGRITRKMLDDIEINEPAGLVDLSQRLFGGDIFSFEFKTLDKPAPYFLYSETEMKKDNPHHIRRNVSVLTHHANDGQGRVGMSASRELMDTLPQRFDDSSRGKVLVAFSEIEFLIDILLCYELGVYRDECTYSEVTNATMKANGIFGSFENKKKYLKLRKVIDRELHTYLSKAQRVRNGVAHGFFTKQNLGLDEKTLGYYNSGSDAVEMIFNYTWLLLVKTYNSYQLDVLKWVEKHAMH